MYPKDVLIKGQDIIAPCVISYPIVQGLCQAIIYKPRPLQVRIVTIRVHVLGLSKYFSTYHSNREPQ
jgi:hypothetical protein